MADACAYRNCDEAPEPGRTRCLAHLAMDARHKAAQRKRLGLSAPSCDRCGSDEHSTAGCPDRADEAAPIRRRLPVVEDPWPELPEDALPPRPRTRGDCEDGPRPCPWVSCKHHLALDVRPSGNLQINFDEMDGRETCALDVAERGGVTLEAVGDVVGVGKERVRQIETMAMERLRRPSAGLIEDYEEIPMPQLPAQAAPAVPEQAAVQRLKGRPAGTWTDEGRKEHSEKIRAALAAKRQQRAAAIQAEDAARTAAQQEETTCPKSAESATSAEVQSTTGSQSAAATTPKKPCPAGSASTATPPSPTTPAPKTVSPPPPDSLGELLQQAGSLARIAAQVQELPRADLEVYIGPRRGERIAELERALEYVRGCLAGVESGPAAAARARIEQVLGG